MVKASNIAFLTNNRNAGLVRVAVEAAEFDSIPSAKVESTLFHRPSGLNSSYFPPDLFGHPSHRRDIAQNLAQKAASLYSKEEGVALKKPPLPVRLC